jgi:hypothetical protein
VARQPGAIAITSYKPTYRDLLAFCKMSQWHYTAGGQFLALRVPGGRKRVPTEGC